MILNDGFWFKVVPLEGEVHVDKTIYYSHRTLAGYSVSLRKGDYSATIDFSYNDVMGLLNEGVWEIMEDGE